MQRIQTFQEAWQTAFRDPDFLCRLQTPALAEDWAVSTFYTGFLPIRARLSCREILNSAGALLSMVPEPSEGWPDYLLNEITAHIYPNHARPSEPFQKDMALCALLAMQLLFRAERNALLFDWHTDFIFLSDDDLKNDDHASEYRRFLAAWKSDYIYELLRLSAELTPYSTLSHIAGVHFVALQVARELKTAGGPLNLSLLSAAAAGHDIGKFGCMPGEPVPYLHYYYTDQWFEARQLFASGQIAANHSTWDLELENMSTESMALIYADFRCKQEKIVGLDEAFRIILGKLDHIDDAKQRRYRYVYRKLRDFEDYMISKGVDVTLQGLPVPPTARKDVALLTPAETYHTFRRMAVGHNLRMIHRLSQEQLFAQMLESAHSEKDWTKLRTYLCIFEEYSTYLSANQKMQTLRFLYELLLHHEGDIRRQAANLMGRILARFNLRYKKEIPVSADPDKLDQTQFALWSQYLNLLVYPDHKLTEQQRSRIHFTTKLVVSAALEYCSESDVRNFLRGLMHYYRDTAIEDDDAALALTDTLLFLPLHALSDADLQSVVSFAARQLSHGNLSVQLAALRFFRRNDTLQVSYPDQLAGSPIPAVRFLLRNSAARSADLSTADIFVENLKTATPWMIKLVNVELLAAHVAAGNRMEILHVAAHFSNLVKASEAVVVRYAASNALLTIAPYMTYDQRNEIAVELAKGLDVGQYEFSKYIPQCLGEFSLHLRPMELDEILGAMQRLISHGNDSVVVGALDTVGVMLEHYGAYSTRYPEEENVYNLRRKKMVGILLKGMASYREAVQQEAMFVFGETLFNSSAFSSEEKAWLYQRCGHKLLFLLSENQGRGLNYLYCSASLYHIYRFLLHYEVDFGGFEFGEHRKIAFFPGAFDPFTLSHKGIVQAIRDLGFEVFLAVDEFSWSKKTQPSLIRRQIVSMSVADEFHVYLFPHDIPVNIANPEDLGRLKAMFEGCELYLTVGSDVVRGASAYRKAPTENSVHTMNHIVFRRVSDLHGDSSEENANLSVIQGDVIQLQLPSQLEDISSTRIRENIDLGRDISNLIDPVVQEYIYQQGLYLREPQYKPVMEAGSLQFSMVDQPELGMLRMALTQTGLSPEQIEAVASAIQQRGDAVMLLRGTEHDEQIVAAAALQYVRLTELYPILQDAAQVNQVRDLASGRLLVLTGLYGQNEETLQYLLTELFTQAMEKDCTDTVFVNLDGAASELVRITLDCQGFYPVGGRSDLLLVEMNSPVVFLQNVETTIKSPFSNDASVLETIRQTRRKLKLALVNLYPGKLILSISTQLVHHRLVQKITTLNNVPITPTKPRILGKCMCVPFGKLLRGHAVPNTVTKTIHTDKIFTPDIRSDTIEAFPYYAPLEDQVRTIHSFRRPVILVDDQLHSGRRIRVLDPLAKKEGLEIKEVLVGVLSGQGKDLMAQWNRTVDYVYFVPNLRAWYVESTLYPFIGGDTVRHEELPKSGLRPSVNLILPYTYPAHLKKCGPRPAYQFSLTCLQNTLEIMLALESAYRRRFARNLTLSRLSEAIILPLCPDKGNLQYTTTLPVSSYLENDLAALRRMENLFL